MGKIMPTKSEGQGSPKELFPRCIKLLQISKSFFRTSGLSDSGLFKSGMEFGTLMIHPQTLLNGQIIKAEENCIEKNKLPGKEES